MMSLSRIFSCQMQREWHIQLRQKKSWINSLVFFAMILIFFPLTMPADPKFLRILAPGLLWLALLLAHLISAERLFQVEYDEGVIELWVVSGYPIMVLVLAKITVHWMLNLLPILLLSPLVALLFGLDCYELQILMISLACGTPLLMALCALAAAFSTSLQQKGVMMGLVLLPLALPVMMLGAAATTAAMAGLPVSAYLAFLLALSCLGAVGLPLAITGVIRAGMV